MSTAATAPNSLSVICPVRTLHGSAGLADEWLAVRTAVRALLAAAEGAAPNGRDYYHQGDGAFKAVVKERGLVLSAIKALSDEIFWVAETILDGPETAGPCLIDFAAAAGHAPASPVMRPTIHLNGTSAEGLKRPCVVVFKAANAAEEALRSIIPNGRDYNPDVLDTARAQHFARVEFVRKVGAYYLLIAMTK